MLTQFLKSCVVVAISTVLLSQPASAKNQRFVVTTSHTPESCLAALDEVNAKGEKFLAMFDWGCMYGNHMGYAIIEAKDEESARKMLPQGMKDVKLEKVGKFTREQIKSFHEKVMER